jgi:phosphotransacetylase
LDNINVLRLKRTLAYLESKQRELKRQNENDTRSLESMIKYLKKDMLEQFKLTEYDIYIKGEIHNTETFIQSVKSIIDTNSK